MSRTLRSTASTFLLAAIAAASLLATGCSSHSAASPGGDKSRDASSSGDTARESAERSLGTIPAKLATILVDYKAGKKQQAYNLAKATSDNLYEGTTEGVVAAMDPAGERQIDPLLAATLPAAIQSGGSVAEVAALIHQAQALARSCLDAIHHHEESQG
jgi:hypothetical protein